MRHTWSRLVFLAALVAVGWVAGPGVAVRPVDKPRPGGELVFLVPSEPPSYDGHREGTFGVVHPLAPHYNTLLRIDPTDTDRARASVPDLAESWTDLAGRADLHAQALRQGVKFHDGSRDDLA